MGQNPCKHHGRIHIFIAAAGLRFGPCGNETEQSLGQIWGHFLNKVAL